MSVARNLLLLLLTFGLAMSPAFVVAGPGGSARHNILSSKHKDTDSTDVPAEGDVASYNSSKWNARPPTIKIFSNGSSTGTPDTLDFSTLFDFDCITDPTKCTITLDTTVYTESDTTVPLSATNLPATGTWSVDQNRIQITADADSANDPIRKAHLDNAANIPDVGINTCWSERVGGAGNASVLYGIGVSAVNSYGITTTKEAVKGTFPFAVTFKGIACAKWKDVTSGNGSESYTIETGTSCSAADGAATACTWTDQTSMTCTISGTASADEFKCSVTGSVALPSGDVWHLKINTADVGWYNCSVIVCSDTL